MINIHGGLELTLQLNFIFIFKVLESHDHIFTRRPVYNV